MEKKDKKDIVLDSINGTKRKNKCLFTKIMLIILLIVSLGYFFSYLVNGDIKDLSDLISSLAVILFTISFVVIGLTNKSVNKNLYFIGSLFLILFYLINLNNVYDIAKINTSFKVIDLRDKSLTEAMNWAANNNIDLNYEYEYSDMVDEYKIISQDIKPNTKVKNIKEITVSISEGPNPYKEIVVPNMVSWDSERVINFVKNNYLSNVNVEFKLSDDKEDTVVEQDKTGNLKRNDEIKLIFSSGEELGYDEVKLIDFTNKSKFETIFYLKQHHLDYEFEEEFDKKIKAGYIKNQEIKAGEMVKVDSKVKLTLSKGPEIKVIDITKLSTTELINWVINNKLKVSFTDKYDDDIKKNKIIEANYKKGDKIAQGTTIEVVISKGQLKMKHFKTLADFKEWADKYSIKYEEQHEFSDSVKAGEVISYSHKKGEIIKNDDVIIVKISDGEKIEVPNLVGLTKKEIQTKLEKLGLNYNFTYKSSDEVKEGEAISQSISKGSQVSKGTTITITISSGKKETKKESDVKKRQETSKSNSNNNNNNSGNSSSNNNYTPTPTCDKSKGSAINIQAGDNANQTKKILQQLNPNHKFAFNVVSSCPNGDTTPGTICNLGGLDGAWKNYCDTIYVTIVN